VTVIGNPNELVTKALLRLVPVPGLAKPAALITLDNGLDHRKPNSFGPAGLASLEAAITEAFAADPAFIAVTGKPYIFCVGADITGMPLITSRDQALALGRLGHRIFARLRDSEVPTFAFINGAAMGGGLGWRCTATTGRCPAARPRWPCRRWRSGWCPAGAAPNSCRT
jgi:enoyl-CoA hydratase/carnithine racemase